MFVASGCGKTEHNVCFLGDFLDTWLDKSHFPEKFSLKVPNCPPTDEYYQVLMNLVDMNIAVLNGNDPSAFYESIRTNLNGKIFLKCARIHLEENVGASSHTQFSKYF